jgi:hypothetical protein
LLTGWLREENDNVYLRGTTIYLKGESLHWEC